MSYFFISLVLIVTPFKHKNIKVSFWDAKKLFQILPFYNTFIKKPEIKKLPNIKLLQELPFYDELNVVKSSNAFSGYAISYKVEIVDNKDHLVQLQASKSSIENLFKDLLDERKGFKYQITVTVLLSKRKINESIEYSPVYFNSTTKTVINSKFNPDKSFQEILYRIDNWISEGSGWIVESMDGEYVNISTYSPLVGNTYIELPDELKNAMKGLINIKNDDNKCVLWCHGRHLNLVERNPQGITKKDKEIVGKLYHEGINFPVSKKGYCKFEMQNNIYINVFCYDIKLIYPIYLSDEKFNDNMDLFLISNEFKSHYVYIKDFDRFMFNKTKNKTKNFL